jgi:ferrochelatase
MSYRKFPAFRHDDPERIGVVLVNSGTPDSPAPADIRRFLCALLSDPRVVELPRIAWLTLLHGVILRVRPRRSAQKYRQIWTDQGSPLLVESEALRGAIRQSLARRALAPFSVELAMLYAKPSVPEALAKLRSAGAQRILVVPLFPQYCGVTTAAVFDQVTAELQRWRWLPELRFINEYHDHPGYIEALRASVQQLWQRQPRQGHGSHLLMSFHSIPEENFRQGDPYHCKCMRTARLLAEELNLPETAWSVSFQSRFGKGRWLQPYTADKVRELATQGVTDLTVVCPGFAVDCLETSEEIAIDNRAAFLAAGGKQFDYVPALNASVGHAGFLAELVAQHVQGWTQKSLYSPADNSTSRSERQRL